MRTVRLRAAGHPAVTGRHDKTLELTAAAAITARATCILAVSAGPLPGELPLLRGRVRLTLAAGGVSAAVAGEVNPAWHSAESLIVRRSGQLDADTYLVNATAAAADLPAGLLAALRDQGAPVEVTAEEVGTPAPVVLVLTGGPATDEIARLAAQADLVVDLTGRGSPAPPVPLPGQRRHRLPERITARTTVVLTDDPTAALPVTRGRRVVLWPPVPGADLLLSAGLPPTPLLQAGRVPAGAAARAQLTRLLARTPAPAALDPAGSDLADLARTPPPSTGPTPTSPTLPIPPTPATSPTSPTSAPSPPSTPSWPRPAPSAGASKPAPTRTRRGQGSSCWCRTGTSGWGWLPRSSPGCCARPAGPGGTPPPR